jgi:predicted transposase/invertase (TIGR01784 family)
MDLVTMDREAYRAYEKREAQIAFYDEDVRSAAREAAKELVAEAVKAAKEAAKNEKLEIARNLKAMGIPIEQISRITNLSAEEVKKL